jgi:hypothetical protein
MQLYFLAPEFGNNSPSQAKLLKDPVEGGTAEITAEFNSMSHAEQK